jgi:multimeric flavodoxin WrbA
MLLAAAMKPIDTAIHKVHLFRLNRMNIRPCQNCGGCDDTGSCVIDDDELLIHTALREADRVILSSPIFFFGLSAQTKVMIDRCQAFWCEKYVLKKPIPSGPCGRKGLLLLVGGMKTDTGIKCAEATARAFFRTVSVPEHETLFYLSVDKKGAVLDHPTALQDAYKAGERLLE